MSVEDFTSKPEYNFLTTNPCLGDNICLLTLGGSHAYGTNVEGSDIDLRGFAIESKQSILCGKRFEQVQDKKTDTVIYGLSKFFKLLSGCNPNIIELLGCKDYVYVNPIGRIVLDNKDLFLSQSAYYTFCGYASAQMKKLSASASTASFRNDCRNDSIRHAINSNLHNVFTQRGMDHEDIDALLENVVITLPANGSEEEALLKHTFVTLIGEHSVEDCHDIVNSIYSALSNIAKGSKHNAEAIKYNKISKHMMHLLRLYMMVIDILEDGEIITYREKEHDLLMSIRNKEFLEGNGDIKQEFFDLVNDYQEKAKDALEKTTLPKKANAKAIDQLLVSIYEEHMF